MKKIPQNIINENTAQKYIENNIYDKYDFHIDAELKIKIEQLKSNIIQNLWLEELNHTTEGICQWLFMIFIALVVIIFKIF